MMNTRLFLTGIAALGLSLAPCAARPASAQQKPAAAPARAPAVARTPALAARPDTAVDLVGLLEAWVRIPPGRRDRMDKLDYLRQWLGSPMLRDQLALIAADAAEPPLARASALIAIGEEKPTNLAPFAFALDDPDATVRAGAAAALRPVLIDPAREQTAAALLRRALLDRVPAVASRALESLGDRDAGALRDFLAGQPAPEMATVARQLLTLAESRGAPLVPRDSSGALERETDGVTLRYVPARRWPDWDASAGSLTVARAHAAPVVLATDVEVVRNVVPATVSGDGRYVAYETGRHIHVRDLETGADRDVGPGIAPRIAPLAPGFVYFRPTRTSLERDRDALAYALAYVPFAGGDSRDLEPASASSHQDVNGNASPVRWARIVESGSGFIITGEGLDAPVTLPDLAASR
jgi:hypothetical protein